MTDEALSLQGQQQAAQAMHRRLVITLVAALVLIGAGWITVWAAGGSPAVAPTPHVPAASGVSRRPSDELLETTKGLQVTQQQAVDQLQVVQDQLVAQQAETKRLSEQIAKLTERLDALQPSVANLPARSTHQAGSIRSPAEITLRPLALPDPGRPLVRRGIRAIMSALHRTARQRNGTKPNFFLDFNPRSMALGFEMLHEQRPRDPISQTGPRPAGQDHCGPAS